VAQLRRQKERFEDAGAQVLLVGMGTPPETAAFASQFDVPFPIVADSKRRLYRTFELGRMQPWGFFSPIVALKGVAAMAQGHLFGLPQGDPRQLPGVFVIDTDGTIIFAHYSSDPSDHPTPDTILNALHTST
jgi:peroxiredoxin